MVHAEGVIGRHGKKCTGLDGSRDGEYVPGRVNDKTRLFLTAEGTRELAEAGRERHGSRRYRCGLMQASDFVRAQQSGGAYVSEVEIERNPITDYRTELGFTPSSWDDCDPRIPPYPKGDSISRKEHVKKLFTDFFFRRKDDPDGTLPVVSALGQYYFQSLADGLERLRELYAQVGGPLIWTHFSHTPNIDIFLASLEINEGKVIVGDVLPAEMGELFDIRVPRLSSDNPHLEVDIRGEVRGYTLSDLRRAEREFAWYARLTPP